MNEFPHKFELGGVKFQGKWLPPDSSLDVFATLAPALGTVLDAIKPGSPEGDEVAKLFSSALGSFKETKVVFPEFVGVYQVDLGQGFVDLKLFKDDAFRGRPTLMIAFLVAAVKSEYSDFLHSNGFNMLQDLGKVLGLQITFKGIGQSGA